MKEEVKHGGDFHPSVSSALPLELRISTSNVNLSDPRSQKVRRLAADRRVYRKHKVRAGGRSVWSSVHMRAGRLYT